MTHINRSVLVEYPAKSMFDLVLDVAAYPQFLPWCAAAQVRERSAEHQIATVSIAKGPLNTHFTTRNTLYPNQQIEIELVDGPFTSLAGNWHFRALAEQACKVELDMRFEFASGPAGMLLRPVFTQICSTLLNAFVERARVVCVQ